MRQRYRVTFTDGITQPCDLDSQLQLTERRPAPNEMLRASNTNLGRVASSEITNRVAVVPANEPAPLAGK
jgi:hypothetical protein